MKFLTFTCLVLVVVVQVSRGDETKVEKQGYIMSNPTSNMGSLYGSMSQSQPQQTSNNQYSSGGYSSGQSGSGQSSGGYYNMANQQQQQQASYGQQPSSGSSMGYGQQSGSQGLIKICQEKYRRSLQKWA